MANMHLVTGYAGREHVTAADHGAFHMALFGSGQFVLNTGNKLAASSPSNNTVRILDGDLLMQGRHVRLNEGSHVDLSIENGTQGYYRNDLIVARYTRNESTGVEEVNLVVIKGTAAASNPADPEHTSGDLITDHAILNDMPLYRVVLNGLAVEELVPVFTALEVNIPALLEMVNAHFHSADDITGGILPVARGGTGVASLAELGAALGNTRIATGSYSGTGKCGSGNKNSLTFEFVPKFVVILQNVASDSGTGALMVSGASKYVTFPKSSSGLFLHASNNVSWNGNAVAWFNNVDQTNGWGSSNCIEYQLNESGKTYRYVAIG